MSTTEKGLSTSKLSASKEYREAFVSAFLKRHIPFQIRMIRKKKNISQQQLAEDSKVTQGVISRAEDPDYGNLTFNTVLRIAAGFDLAFIGKFVRFSELLKVVEETEESLDIPSFLEECKQEAVAEVKKDAAAKTQAGQRLAVGDDLSWPGNSLDVANHTRGPFPDLMTLKELVGDSSASGAVDSPAYQPSSAKQISDRYNGLHIVAGASGALPLPEQVPNPIEIRKEILPSPKSRKRA